MIVPNKLLAYLVKFNTKYPKVKVRIITDSAVNLNNYLLEHKIDVLLDYLPNINNSILFLNSKYIFKNFITQKGKCKLI